MIYTEEILDKMVGKSITCTIHGTIITDAKLTKHHQRYFICQNVLVGDDLENRLGYSCSWYFNIYNGDGSRSLTAGVTDLKLLKSETYEIY